MTVQAGIWNLDGEPVNRDFLTKVSQETAEYGPDGETTYFEGPVGMLYRPFHTTAESRLEHQPYFSAGGKIMTWDGRLDNRADLMAQLCHVLNDDQTDVSIVATAFDRWGADCFSKIIGDWAVAIWDPQEKELILARDYIGVRHLFYYPKPKRVIWCNHLGPLALCGDQFALCHEYIAGYLAFEPEAQLTPYRQIQSVSPGKFVRIHNAQISIQTYWAFNTRLRIRYKTDAEYEEHYRQLFRQSVRRRLRTDSSVLANLSGGLDSSSIVCMADDILGKEGSEVSTLDTFSFHDSNEPGEDDLPHFTKVEEKRRKRGFHADLRGSGASLSFEPPFFFATPGFGNRAEVNAALSEVLRQHKYRVMLSGTGGDEMNGQTLDPRILMADLFMEFRLAELTKQLITWSLVIRKRPWIQLLLQTVLLLMPISIRARMTARGKVDPWVCRAFARGHKISARQMEAVEGLRFSLPSVRDAVQTIVSLSGQMTRVRPSVIEQRYPYLDKNLVEFLTAIPFDQLLRPGQRRSLMRRALQDLLPSEVLARKTKAITGRCYSVALDKQWDKVESIVKVPLSSLLGYFDRDRLHEALLAMKNGHTSAYFVRLLKALSLELWLRDAEARGVISIHSSVSHAAGRTLVESRI